VRTAQKTLSISVKQNPSVNLNGGITMCLEA